MIEINKTWSLGGTSIAVEDDSLDYLAVRMGLLGPLDSTYSVGHYGGTESAYRDIKFVILSGYENNFLPIVGTGYHTLVSDQGEEGDYFVTSVRSERLQALNKEVPVFRVAADLRKKPPAPPEPPAPAMPGNVYFAARGNGGGANNGGVWVTHDFTDAETATQPVWTKLATTGSWPADNYLLSFGADINDPAEYVYALTGDDYEVTGHNVIRYSATSGTWTTILSSATVVATHGVFAYLTDLMVDPVTGYLFVMVNVRDSTYHCFYRCTDPSATVPVWTYVQSSSYYHRGLGNIWVYDDVVTYVYTMEPAGQDEYLSQSTAGGAISYLQILNSISTACAHQVMRDEETVLANWSDHETMARYQLGDAHDTAVTVCSEAAYAVAWITQNGHYVPVFMPHPTTTGTIRFIANFGSYRGKLLTTTDFYTTYTNQGLLDIGTGVAGTRYINSIVPTVNEEDYDFIIYGSTDAVSNNTHSIYAAYGSTDLTPTAKSGAHPDTGVDSIHYLAGGPCNRGIQPYFT